MMHYPTLVPGTLLRRYKRFLADVRLDSGEEVVAHCPNTGSMKAVNVPGLGYGYRPATTPNVSWPGPGVDCAAPAGRRAGAGLGAHRAGQSVGRVGHTGGRHSPLAGYATLKREVKVADARLDFRLDDPVKGTAYVEVKQVTLKENDGHGYFPDSVSERGTRHLHHLTALAQQGERAVLLFCVAHEGIEDVAPAAHIDPVYATALAGAMAAGVDVLAYGIRLEWRDAAPFTARLNRALTVRA